MGEVRVTGYQNVRAGLLDRSLTRSHDRERYETGNILDGVVLVLHGQPHADRRRYENPLVRRRPLEHYESVVFPTTIGRTLPRMIAADGTLDLVEFGGYCSVVVASRIAGIDLEDGDIGRASQLFRLVRVFSQGVSILDALDEGPEEIKARVQSALREFERDFYADSRARRVDLLDHAGNDSDAEEKLPRDLLTNLLRHQHELDMDDATILRETAFFVGAGSHTNSQNVPNSIHLILEWCESHPSDEQRLTTDRPFVQRCVHEAIRLRPTTPVIKRWALADGQIGDQEIREGDCVALDILSANTDPSVYGQLSDVFDPLREVPEDVPRYGVSFGGGMHSCLGKTVAGGELPRGDAEERDNYLFGLVTLMVEALVQAGVRSHPHRVPTPNTRSTRWAQWSDYPVRMEGPRSPKGSTIGHVE